MEHGDGAFTIWYADAAGELGGVLTHERDEEYGRGRAAVPPRPPERGTRLRNGSGADVVAAGGLVGHGRVLVGDLLQAPVAPLGGAGVDHRRLTPPRLLPGLDEDDLAPAHRTCSTAHHSTLRPRTGHDEPLTPTLAP